MSALQAELDDFERFLDEKTWRPTTIQLYRWLIDHLANWMMWNGPTSFSGLTIRDVKAFLASVKWGNSMTRKLNSALLQFVRWKFGQAHALLNWHVRREKSPPQRTLNKQSLETLYASFQPGISSDFSNTFRRFAICDTGHPLGIRNFAIIRLMVDTGFRSAEICNLELARLDMQNYAATGLVKFGRWRTARFSERTAAALSAWLSVRPHFANNSPRLFTPIMNKGQRMTESGLRNMLRKLGRLTGIGMLSPHDFRRTFATECIRNGASVQAVKEAGGWRSTEVLMDYTRAITAEEILPFLPGNLV